MKIFKFKINLLSCYLVCLSTVCLISPIHAKSFSKGRIYLNIQFVGTKQVDTLILSLDNIVNTLLFKQNNSFRSTANEQGKFLFEIPVYQDYGYFILSKKRDTSFKPLGSIIRILEPQFWEVGDSVDVYIKLDEKQFGTTTYSIFSGKGGDKYNLINNFKRLGFNAPLGRPDNWKGNILSYPTFDKLTAITLAKVSILDANKTKISNIAYDVLKANLYFESTYPLGIVRDFVQKGNLDKLSAPEKGLTVDRLRYSFGYPTFYKLEQSGLENSINFIDLLGLKLSVSSFVNTGKFSLDWVYQTIKEQKLSTDIKETLILRFLYGSDRSEERTKVYQDALKYIKNPEKIKMLRELNIANIGKKFTDVGLLDPDGKLRRISEFRGKVVFIDFWFTGCGNCITYHKNILTPIKERFKNNKDVVFISISLDRNKETWKNSINKGIYTSSNSINLYTNGYGFEHPALKEYNINGAPFCILLNKHGIIENFNTESLYNEDALFYLIQKIF